ncbi:fimbrial biogenesis chaperone (plasmid) [Klebsiella aerogenes]
MNSYFSRLTLALGAISALFSVQGYAGIVVSGTRFVVTASEHSKSITVRNTGNEGFLVKSEVLPDKGEELEGTDNLKKYSYGENPFAITPPLYLLNAGKESKLRLECVSCQDLPKDRETFYRLGISAIPGGKPGANTVQLAIRSTFKLFYRPDGLPGKANDAYKKLKWKREGKNIVVNNPSPYYVTLFELSVNNKKVRNPGMVAPFSSRIQPWCPATGSCQLKWTTLNDFGGVTPEWSVTPEGVVKEGLSTGN